MMKKIFIVAAIIVSISNAFSNDTTAMKKNAISLEIGGNGLFLSANYQRHFPITEKCFLSGEVGIGSVPFVGGLSIPHQITINFGQKNSFFETGVGGSYWTGKTNASGYTEREFSYMVSPIIGYRLQTPKGFLFRGYLSPLISVVGEPFIGNSAVTPMGGISFGIIL